MEVAISAAMCSMVKPGGSAGNVDSGSASSTGGGVGLDCATVGGCGKCMVVGTDGIRLCFGMEGVCISRCGTALMLRVDCDGVVGMLLCVVLLIEIGAVEVGLRLVVFDNGGGRLKAGRGSCSWSWLMLIGELLFEAV